MERCPACNAKYTGKKYCHRCQTDLGRLLGIKEKALEHRNRSGLAFVQNDLDTMFFHAQRAFYLYETQETAKLFACAAILHGKFDLAVFLWRRARGVKDFN